MPSRWMFPHRGEIEIMTGSTGEMEPIFDAPQPTPCLVIEGARLVEGGDGREEVGEATAYCPISVPQVPVGSRFTHGGRQYRVLRCRRWSYPGRPRISSVELGLA